MARPRKPGKREPNGKLSRAERDHGTPENQLRRQWLAQNGDPNMTSFPLGILRANDQITNEQYQNGCKFAWLYAVVFGRASRGAQSHLGDRTSGSERDVAATWLAEQQTNLNRAMFALEAINRKTRDTVMNICVYERMPRFLSPAIPTESDYAEGRRLIAGLNALEAVMAQIDAS